MCPTNDEVLAYPHTVQAAVELVLSRMSDDLRAWLSGFDGDELALCLKLAAGMGTGMSVRALLGLWGKNAELLARLPRSYQHPDSASSFFLIECWKRLRAEVAPNRK